jgi:hypothetical protein
MSRDTAAIVPPGDGHVDHRIDRVLRIQHVPAANQQVVCRWLWPSHT